MATDLARSLLAVNVGNSRLAIGHFFSSPSCEAAAAASILPIAGPLLPEPDETLHIDAGSWNRDTVLDWLTEQRIEEPVWAIGSVNRPLADQVAAWINEQGYPQPWWVDWRGVGLPLDVRVPEQVGVDRLLAAVAADRLREDGRATIVVDFGTAITVDLLTAQGAFAGGAILPGVELGSRALHERTDALPRVRLTPAEPPRPVGRVTEEAIHAGLYWGAVGAVNEIITQMSHGLDNPPDLLLTGGWAPTFAHEFAPAAGRSRPWRRVQSLPHLVLSGIVLSYKKFTRHE